MLAASATMTEKIGGKASRFPPEDVSDLVLVSIVYMTEAHVSYYTMEAFSGVPKGYDDFEAILSGDKAISKEAKA